MYIFQTGLLGEHLSADTIFVSLQQYVLRIAALISLEVFPADALLS